MVMLILQLFDTVFRLMMEKFDGIRVYWNGKNLYVSDSRTPLKVPKEHAFSSIPFEGELW
jgi:hypothetical protein